MKTDADKHAKTLYPACSKHNVNSFYINAKLIDLVDRHMYEYVERNLECRIF